MNSEDLKNRTKQFALKIIKIAEEFPKTNCGFVIGKQIIKSSTSIGANYRSACRAKSKADFIAKLCIVEEETDETMYWLELAMDTGLIEKSKGESLLKEANEILSIIVASKKTAKSKL